MLGNLKSNQIFFSGIGGVSMNALAIILKEAGYEVLGSDRASSLVTDRLSAKGIDIFIGQKAENITPDIGLLVRTAAVPQNHHHLYGSPLSDACRKAPHRDGWWRFSRD